MKDKELLALIDKAFSAARESAEGWSKATQELFEQVHTYYLKTQRKFDWPVEESKQWYSSHLPSFVNSLTEELIRHFEAGNFPLAYQEHILFFLFAEALKRLGKKKDIAPAVKTVKKNIAPVFRKLQKKKERKTVSLPLGIGRLPAGTYLFHSHKEGATFYLKISIEVKEGLIVISYYRKGLPLAKGQWEEASAGNHPAVIGYVDKEIIQKAYQQPYLILK